MQFASIPRLLTLALALAVTTAAWSADVSLKKEDVPAAVLATMEKAGGGQKLIDFEKETGKDGKVVFTANFKDTAGKEQEIEVAPDGTLIKVAPE
jgi:hypothetical protein